MKKMLIAGMIGAVALVFVAKKTNVCSYATTAWTQVETTTKDQIPTKFELDRIRNEVAALDGDINQMIRPIAEYRVAIERMKKDIAKTETNIAEQKKKLLTVVEDLQAKRKFVINGVTYTEARVRDQLQRDTEGVKLLERNAKAQQQVLEAKEQSLRATQEQLAKVINKKREYEVRLAQLEAEEETLKIAKIGSDIKIDSSRATHIESSLNEIERRLDVEKARIEMQNGDLANIPLHDRTVSPLDLSAIRTYLEGTEPADKAASNK